MRKLWPHLLLIAGVIGAVWCVRVAKSTRAGKTTAEVQETGSLPSREGVYAAPESQGLEYLTAEVVNVYPHDRSAFTQGLLWHDGHLYESTGLNGASSVRRVELETGAEVQRVELPPELFGEGLERVGEELIQLTWRSTRALRYNAADLESRGEYSFPGEGWGLCLLGNSLWRSDGTAALWEHDPVSFDVRRRLAVDLEGEALARLNELECANGSIYANVLNADEIYRIDPSSGEVNARIDASGLIPAGERPPANVLNGIAYRPETETFLVTGKLWPKLFEVRFVPAD